MNNITATVDTKILQEKANEFAMKGALKAIEEFYTRYDSPYVTAVTESLSQTSVNGYKLKLPDIVALINEKLTTEIDKIANTTIAKTFIPLVSKVLTRQSKECDFSEILKEFVETCTDEDKYQDDFSVDIEKDIRYGWLNVIIKDNKRSYSFTLHEEQASKKTNNIKYVLLSLPHTDNTEKLKMKIQIDGATLELPFVRDILKDSFVSSLAGYIISRSIITMNTTEFTDEMFPNNCHCH